MQPTLFNILRNSLKSGYFIQIFMKIIKRMEKTTAKEALLWAKANSSNLSSFCKKQNETLWEETMREYNQTKKRATKVIKSTNQELGGGGSFPLIYFLCRLNKPKVIVETGVAAGWSSYAALKAIENNGSGHLYSSDFPYFRLKNPEKYIGLLVPKNLKPNWNLDIRGDSVSLPSILDKIDEVGLFHYDSDKSYSGRKFAFKLILQKSYTDTVLIMDDIQDNTFFKNFVSENKVENFFVFEFENKFVGLVSNCAFLEKD